MKKKKPAASAGQKLPKAKTHSKQISTFTPKTGHRLLFFTKWLPKNVARHQQHGPTAHGSPECWTLELLQCLEKFPGLKDGGCNVVGSDTKARARRALQYRGSTPKVLGAAPPMARLGSEDYLLDLHVP